MKWPLPTALLATLLLVGWVWWRDRSSSEPVAASPSPSAVGTAPLAARAVPAAPQPASRQASASPQAVQVDVFPLQSWEPPPVPPPTIREPPELPPHLRPSPPSPFRVMSLWWDQNDLYVVLSASGQEFSLCAKCNSMDFQTRGAVLMGSYRVESIRPDGIDMVYLPNGKEEHLPLPGVESTGGRQ